MGPLSSLVQIPAGGASLGSSVATGAGAVGAVAVAAVAGAFPAPIEPPPETEAMAFTTPELEPEVVPAPIYAVGDVDLQTGEDQSLTFDLGALVDAPMVSIDLFGRPHAGTATLSADGIMTFEPPPDFHGTVSVPYRVCFVDGSCDEGLITITVGSINDAPRAGPDQVTIPEDTTAAVEVLLNDYDVDEGERLTITGVAVIGIRAGTATGERPVRLEATIEDDTVVLTPGPNWWGRPSSNTPSPTRPVSPPPALWTSTWSRSTTCRWRSTTRRPATRTPRSSSTFWPTTGTTTAIN